MNSKQNPVRPTPEVRWLGRIGYPEALRLQEEAVENLRRGGSPETVFLLEHDGVYTIGRTRDQSSLQSGVPLPHPVVQTNRGGQATYHGPGQLVGYPILDLKQRTPDLHRYLRLLEQTLIDFLAECGINASRRDNLTGVWVEERKIASLGVGVRKWITMHGFALNLNRESLAPFQSITPCGIRNVRMTSVESETGTAQPVKQAAKRVADILLHRLKSELHG